MQSVGTNFNFIAALGFDFMLITVRLSSLLSKILKTTNLKISIDKTTRWVAILH